MDPWEFLMGASVKVGSYDLCGGRKYHLFAEEVGCLWEVSLIIT